MSIVETKERAVVGDNPWTMAGEGAPGTKKYMKYKGATGVFSYGQDEEEIPHDTRLAADVEGSRWNWSFWWEGEILETIETDIRDDPKGFKNEPEYLPEEYVGDMTLEEIRAERDDKSNNFMDGWSCQAVIDLTEIGGEENVFELKLNSGVALNSFVTLLVAYGAKYKYKNGALPVVSLGANKFTVKAKGIGKRFAPVLKIVDWISPEDLANGGGENPADYEKPVSAQKALAAPDDGEGEDEDGAPKEAPRGRRGARGANLG